MILDRVTVTVKQGKTQYGRGLTTDLVAHAVTDADAVLNYISRPARNPLRRTYL